ncbi:MAG TPA: glycosyltransferase family 39 protein [Anaerolineales bacterium]|nr:glycosyltransferase family 39 protein [Anaerolineales bacterium]
MEQDTQNSTEPEPTVLDLYKSVTKDWSSFFNFVRSLWDTQRREEFNQTLAQETAQPVIVEQVIEPTRVNTFPWRAVMALLLGVAAQSLVEPPLRQSMLSLMVYLAAIGVAFWSYRSNEWHLPTLPASWQASDPLTFRLLPLICAVLFGSTAFVTMGENRFTWFNTTFWLLAVFSLAYSLWVRPPKPETEQSPVSNRLMWYALVLAMFGLVVFLRFYKLTTVPIEPFSDHAEKILDVYEITEGDTRIFFERNTGREAIQMYWTLLVLNIFGTGFSFLSLKIGTVLLGIFTVPFVYMLGKEYGSERVGLFALFLFGVASWPNIIARVGLRFPLYPLFVAPTLFYLIRGLRTHNRNDIILAGIFLGLGLHGYSPFRMMPIFVGVVFLIYFLHAGSKEKRQQAIFWFMIVVIISLFVFLPLLRYWVSNPDQFGYRAFTRLSDIEAPLSAPAWQIFLSNMYKGMLMFNWDDGEIGTHSVTHRPALDMISAALFLLGVAFLVVRYIRQRDWRDMALLVSIPVLILPSVLSLAFPGENPALNRAGGASVTVFLAAALALDGFVSSFGAELRRKIIAYSLVGAMFTGIAYFNYDLAINQWGNAFALSSWNTSEMGQVLSDFRDKYGETDTVWIVPFPFWVDTRLPGVWAGIPNRDFALFQDHLADSLNYPEPKMFLYWNVDTETERILKELYPNGKVTRYTSAFPGKDFYIFLVEP